VRRAGALGAVALLAVAGGGGCGRKAAPRPPELVRPRSVDDLAARPTAEGIRLTWTRPTTTVEGRAMRDLAGFVVTRAAKGPAVPRFEPIATIQLDDRARFRKVREMAYDDRGLAPGEPYLYRVVAFTLDRYFSTPSPAAEATWPGPGAAAPAGEDRTRERPEATGVGAAPTGAP
jgi:hypothetical protein